MSDTVFFANPPGVVSTRPPKVVPVITNHLTLSMQPGLQNQQLCAPVPVPQGEQIIVPVARALQADLWALQKQP